MIRSATVTLSSQFSTPSSVRLPYTLSVEAPEAAPLPERASSLVPLQLALPLVHLVHYAACKILNSRLELRPIRDPGSAHFLISGQTPTWHVVELHLVELVFLHGREPVDEQRHGGAVGVAVGEGAGDLKIESILYRGSFSQKKIVLKNFFQRESFSRFVTPFQTPRSDREVRSPPLSDQQEEVRRCTWKSLWRSSVFAVRPMKFSHLQSTTTQLTKSDFGTRFTEWN